MSGILIDLEDGTCNCSGELVIVGADDSTLEVECIDCGESKTVEIDAFGDGGVKYWPEAMVEFGGDF